MLHGIGISVSNTIQSECCLICDYTYTTAAPVALELVIVSGVLSASSAFNQEQHVPLKRYI